MKILMTVQGDHVAPRFDLTTELVIARAEDGELQAPPRSIIMDRSSPEALCSMIMEENITAVVCGGIEDRYYQFLSWKKIAIYDNVIGLHLLALQEVLAGRLQAGQLFSDGRRRERHP